MDKIAVDSEQAREYAIKLLMDCDIGGGLEFALDKAKPKRRTLTQNRCLHEYCTTLANAMSSAGFDQRAVISQFKDGFYVPWTMEAVKNIFRNVGSAMYDVKSTADLNTVQMQKVYQAFDSTMSRITAIHVEWPSIESKRYEK